VKEKYKHLQVLLKKICYEEHWWDIHADLKVTAMPPALQGGYLNCAALNVNGTAK
jgi:hypothetical protein